MAATPLSDDGVTVAYQLDNGQVVNVPRDAAIRAGAPLPTSSPAAPAIPSVTPGMGAPPPSTPSLGAPLDMSKAQGIPPPPAPSGNVYDEQAPLVQPAIVPARADDAMFAGKNAAAVPAAGPGAMPPPAKTGVPMPAKPGAPAAPGTPGRFGAIVDEGNQAAAMQQQAIDERATVDKAANDQIAKTLTDRNAALEEQRQKQLADAKASADEIERRGKTIDAAIASYAKTKIDPNRMWNGLSGGGKAGLIFAQVLSGLGQALKHKGGENPAIDMWMKQTQQDIQLQMADLEKQRGVIDMNKGALATFKDLAATKQGVFALAMAGETDRAAKSLEQIAAQTKSDLVKSNALEASAVLKQQSANFKGEWAKTEFTSDLQAKAQAEEVRQHKANEGVAYGHLALARDQFTESKRHTLVEENRADEMWRAQLAEKASEAQARNETASQKAYERIQEQGAFDSNGNTFVQPEGEAAIAMAKNLERRAAKAATPGEANELARQAKLYREKAQITAPWVIAKDQAKDVRNKISSAQQAVNGLDELTKLISDGGVTAISDNARASALYAMIKANAGEALRARFNEKEQETLDGIFGGDPSKIKNIDVRELGTYKARFDQISKTITEDANNVARHNGYRGTASVITSPTIPKTDAQNAYDSVLGDKTREEDARSEQRTKVGNTVNDVLYDLGGVTWNKIWGKERADSKPDAIRQREAVLSDKQYATIKQLADGYAKAGPEQRDDIELQLRKLTTSDRPELAQGVYSALRNENPTLANAVALQLSPQQRASIGAKTSTDRAVESEDKPLSYVSPSQAFRDLPPTEIAKAIGSDPALAQYVQLRARSGSREEMLKAAQVVAAVRR